MSGLHPIVMKVIMIFKYFLNVLIGVDQLGNTILGGDPDETISSRLGKMKKARRSYPLEKTIIKNS